MKELKKNKRLTYLVVAIVAIILIGIISIQKPAISYKLSTANTLKALNDTTAYITPQALNQMMRAKNTSIVVIDVRNTVDYNLSHLENTVNIPVREIFETENLKKLSEITKGGQTIILIGESQQQAIGPWMMLKQTGFDLVKVFTGVYSQLATTEGDSLIAALPQYTETPLIDTAAIKAKVIPVVAKPAQTAVAKPVKKAVTPVKVEESSGGGC